MKKKFLCLTSCLLLAMCFMLCIPKAVQASTAYKTISPFEYAYDDGENRDKVGSNYFFIKTDSNYNFQLRFSTNTSGSGYLISKSFRGDSLVTNGTTVYYATTGNVLYKYSTSTKSNTKIKALSSTLKSRLGSSDLDVSAIALYGNLLYLQVIRSYDFEEYGYIYTYNLKTGTLSQVKKNAKFKTTNGRYLVYSSNDSTALYRYDLKNKVSKTIYSNSRGVDIHAATYQDKLYVYYNNYSESTDKYTGGVREYSYSTLSYSTIKTFSIATDAGFCYNGYIYYYYYNSNYDEVYYRCSISTGKTSKISESSYYSARFNSYSSCVF